MKVHQYIQGLIRILEMSISSLAVICSVVQDQLPVRTATFMRNMWASERKH